MARLMQLMSWRRNERLQRKRFFGEADWRIIEERVPGFMSLLMRCAATMTIFTSPPPPPRYRRCDLFASQSPSRSRVKQTKLCVLDLTREAGDHPSSKDSAQEWPQKVNSVRSRLRPSPSSTSRRPTIPFLARLMHLIC